MKDWQVVCATCGHGHEPLWEGARTEGRGCHAEMMYFEGVLSLVAGRGSRRFAGETWIVVSALPEGTADDSDPVCDECIMQLVERGVVRREE